MASDSGEISWVCHPARHRPVTAAAVGLLLLLIWVGVHLSFRDPVLTGIAVLVLWLSLAPFYLPTTYRMSQDKIHIRGVFGRKEKRWELYRRFEADRHGILLSPFDRPSRLDRFHGLNLRFDAHDRERVVEYVGSRLERNDGQA